MYEELRKLAAGAAAISNVYTAEVMDSLNLVARGVTAKLEAIKLSEAYLKNASRVAQVRAMEASRRLAEIYVQMRFQFGEQILHPWRNSIVPSL